MDLNQIIIIGKLTKNIETKYTASGKELAKFTVLVESTLPSGKVKQTYFDVVAWNEKVNDCVGLSKDSRVFVIGKMESSGYTDQNGNKTTYWEITASRIIALGEVKTTITDEDFSYDDIISKELVNKEEKEETNDDFNYVDDLPF